MPGRLRWRVAPHDAGARLDKFLAAPSRLGSRRQASRALDGGRVSIDGTDVGLASAGQELATGSVVEVWTDKPGSARRRTKGMLSHGLRIVFEDEWIIVVDKPAGVLTVPLPRRPESASVADLLHAHFSSGRHVRPKLVHRIDRDTSGLVVFAKTPRAWTSLKSQFEAREPLRQYWAVVHGVPQPRRGEWRDTLAWDAGELTQRVTHRGHAHAREAVCRYRVVERFARAALLEVELDTGRRNQIRVQASRRGHMLVGERHYLSDPLPSPVMSFPRQALHARRLEIRHPATHALLVLEAEPPADFRRLLDHLRTAR